MESTRSHHRHVPASPDPPAGAPDGNLTARYRAILDDDDPGWAAGCRDLRLVGRGGQGVVFFARREGADGFALPIALKVFSPDPEEVAFAKKVLEAIPDGRGVHMIDGKMQDDATWKQCKVMVGLAEMLAKKDPELAEAYGFTPAGAAA